MGLGGEGRAMLILFSSLSGVLGGSTEVMEMCIEGIAFLLKVSVRGHITASTLFGSHLELNKGS